MSVAVWLSTETTSHLSESDWGQRAVQSVWVHVKYFGLMWRGGLFAWPNLLISTNLLKCILYFYWTFSLKVLKIQVWLSKFGEGTTCQIKYFLGRNNIFSRETICTPLASSEFKRAPSRNWLLGIKTRAMMSWLLQSSLWSTSTSTVAALIQQTLSGIEKHFRSTPRKQQIKYEHQGN